jgi:adenylosuccinate lyase
MSYRYVHAELASYTSEQARILYMASVESSIVIALYERGLCPRSVMTEIIRACAELKATEVYLREYGKKGKVKGTKHDVRALVLSITRRIRKLARPYVHAWVTSCDILNTADSARTRDVVEDKLLPELKQVEVLLAQLAIRFAHMKQVGRTHRQQASTYTVGATFAEYVSRLGKEILKLEREIKQLVGKVSGPVGSYGPASLFIRDPLRFEKQVLACMALRPGEFSTQIVMPEAMTDVAHRLVVIMGIFADLADSMRGLQATEIGEISEGFEAGQVGSSIMAHKMNPVSWENIKALFKVMMPRMITVYLDLISEHQRDLTNSASGRFTLEMVELLFTATKTLKRVLPKLTVNEECLRRNLYMTGDLVISDPLITLLAHFGHPSAHKYVQQLTKRARARNAKVYDLFMQDRSANQYRSKLNRKQHSVLKDHGRYVGIAPQQAIRIGRRWTRRFKEVA